MVQDREAIMEALKALFQNALQGALPPSTPKFVTVIRKFLSWDACGAEMRPALLIVERSEEDHVQDLSLPSISTIDVGLIIYVTTSDAPQPMTILNNLLKAVDAALAPGPPPYYQLQNLGGLVNAVYKEGKTIKIAGDLDGDGILLVPLKVLVP